MERVEGCTLAEALRALRPAAARRADRRRPPGRRRERDAPRARRDARPAREPAPIALFAGSFVEAALRIAAQVAEALAHAHERGVLHRDVKPSNVMLTPGGRVLLLDFGLATTGEVSRLTQTGTLIGSLPYLPPENFSGEAPAPRRGRRLLARRHAL
jgi:aminoglycoside phosphotransferase (APT) family kinase protein